MEDSMKVVDPSTKDQRTKDLQKHIETAKSCERLLKAHLASLGVTSSSDDVWARITVLELEKEKLVQRLDELRSGKIKAVPSKEKEMVDQELDDWTKKAISRKQIFMELWAVVLDGLPKRKTKDQLWEEIGLEHERDEESHNTEVD
ncbi:MAG: hypothetical protein Q9182_001849 [Xanthomendoza sp. 2 TL-2023]